MNSEKISKENLQYRIGKTEYILELVEVYQQGDNEEIKKILGQMADWYSQTQVLKNQ